jgi:hypothetical protein
MIDATQVKARTAASLLETASSKTYRAHQMRLGVRRIRRQGRTAHHAAQRRPDERLQARGANAARDNQGQGNPRRPKLL